eukprot:TRINITY_DN3210_c0_g1_i1.p1 TRINITY_DN3210_c0_g1~~TRINITY_DN3210_c0_g1_i1.p1  ORF type:complete len:214 (-),score=60.49 TRINITY_DN3210_c0_g1_i1:23-664(-)
MDLNLDSVTVPWLQDIPEPPEFLKKLRNDPKYKRTGFDVDFPILLEPEVRYENGSRGKPFGRNITYELYWNETEQLLDGGIFFNINCEGPPSCVHGGAIATALDSVSAYNAYRSDGFSCVTLNLNINYKRFIPLNTMVQIQAKTAKTENRKIWVEAKLISPQGEVHAECSTLFFIVNEKKRSFEKMQKLIGRDSGITKEQILNALRKRNTSKL